MPVSPVDLLFGTYRREVLGLLLLRPEDRLYVREISRLTGVPAGSLHRELRALTDAGLLQREPAGNQVRYRANRDCPIYRELAEIFRKTTGLVDLLRDALSPRAKRIAAAFVFGSMAQRSDTATSDVDLMVIGRASFADVVAALAPLRERLGREINPVVMSRARFVAQRKDRFLKTVMAEPKLFVIESADELG